MEKKVSPYLPGVVEPRHQERTLLVQRAEEDRHEIGVDRAYGVYQVAARVELLRFMELRQVDVGPSLCSYKIDHKLSYVVRSFKRKLHFELKGNSFETILIKSFTKST